MTRARLTPLPRSPNERGRGYGEPQVADAGFQTPIIGVVDPNGDAAWPSTALLKCAWGLRISRYVQAGIDCSPMRWL